MQCAQYWISQQHKERHLRMERAEEAPVDFEFCFKYVRLRTANTKLKIYKIYQIRSIC